MGDLALRNVCFAVDALAVRQRGDKVDVGKRGRKYTTANRQDFAGNSHGFSKITGHMG